MPELTYDDLRQAVEGAAVALRVRTDLQPAGGDGDKIAPPTYGDPQAGAARQTKYAIESRVVDGKEHVTVLLDSVAAQANRLEEALLEGWERGELSFPVPFVDFTGDERVADLDRITALEAPHRVADAIFRDSLLDGTLFRLSDVGIAITESRAGAATGLFRYCPTALLFGMWDSTGPKGGLGAKFQRAIVSEVVGFDATTGKAVGSRIDPLAIERDAVPIYQAADAGEGWTLDPSAAAIDDKGKPTAAIRPSEINHGNVAPSIDERAGGVSVSCARQTLVLSFPALRRLRFPVGSDGAVLETDRRRVAEVSARTAVAALGVAAIAYQHELDFDLRSRCLLVPTHEPRVEVLRRDGAEPEIVTVSQQTAQDILDEAASRAASDGLGWHTDELRLVPAPKLVTLIERSRARASAVGAAVEG